MALCPRCLWYVGHAVQAIRLLGHGLSPTQAQALWATPAVRNAEAAVDDAALLGDVQATKTACRAWWDAARRAITTIRQNEGVTA